MTPCPFSPASALHSLRPLPRFVTIAARWVTLSRQGILQVVFRPALRHEAFHDARAIAIFRLRCQRCATYTRGTGGHHEPRAADPLASLALLASRHSLDAAG